MEEDGLGGGGWSRGGEKGCLKEFGVTYKQVDFLENGDIDIEGSKAAISDKTKLVMIQRSKGYAWRKSLSIADIKEAIEAVKSVKKDVIRYVKRQEIPVVPSLCPYEMSENSKRLRVKNLINDLAKENKDVRSVVFNSIKGLFD